MSEDGLAGCGEHADVGHVHRVVPCPPEPSCDPRGEAGVVGSSSASLVAPFITAVPVTEVWVMATAAPVDPFEAAGADPVADGHNVVFLQAKDDTPLAFSEQAAGVWVASRFRVYADLRRDPRRGREQADHLRREVIGF